MKTALENKTYAWKDRHYSPFPGLFLHNKTAQVGILKLKNISRA